MSVSRTALALALMAREPVFVWGMPGTTKTKSIEALGNAMKRKVRTFIAAIHEPSDIGGHPIPEGDCVRYLISKTFADFISEENGILFLDDVPEAPPAMQAALFRVVLERIVGEQKLLRSTSVVAAGNPPEKLANAGWSLKPALANRFVHIYWTVDHEEWCEGLLSGFPDPILPEIPEAWESLYLPQANSMVVGFLRTRPQCAEVIPKDDQLLGGPWPSRRSWTMAGRMLALSQAYAKTLVDENIADSVKQVLISGCIGPSQANEFITWARELDLPNPADLLKNPQKCDIPERDDRLYAALGAVESYFLQNQSEKNYLSALELLVKVKAKRRDIAAIYARRFAAHQQPEWETPAHFHDFMEDFEKAGLLVTSAPPKNRKGRSGSSRRKP